MTVVGLADGGSADTGERARGGDQNRRFVDVLETTAPLTPDGLALVADAVVPAYAEFAPRCLRVWVATPPAWRRRSRPMRASGRGARWTSTSSRGPSASCAHDRGWQRTRE